MVDYLVPSLLRLPPDLVLCFRVQSHKRRDRRSKEEGRGGEGSGRRRGRSDVDDHPVTYGVPRRKPSSYQSGRFSKRGFRFSKQTGDRSADPDGPPVHLTGRRRACGVATKPNIKFHVSFDVDVLCSIGVTFTFLPSPLIINKCMECIIRDVAIEELKLMFM